MLAWLKNFFGAKRRAKATEVLCLKAEMEDKLAKCKERAAKGDSDASLRLGALKQNLAEQSLRLLPKKSKALGVIMLVVLALGVGGCGGGLGAKTAKDIETASEMILPEYLAYVEADPKLKDAQKQDRKNQVRALRDVIRAAQK